MVCVACGRPWSVCEVVLVPYVNAVSVVRLLLFVLDVSMLSTCGSVQVLCVTHLTC